MKNLFLPLLFAALFAACSQEGGEAKKNEPVIKVDRKVEKSGDKDMALICIDEAEKITCKLMTKRLNKPRSVLFHWRSPNSPDDDREYTLTLPAAHASVFDMRHKEGRAKGEWEVTADIEGEEVSTTFYIE